MADLPGVRSKVGLGGSGEKYLLVLTGEDPQALATAAAAVEKDLRTIPGLGSIASSASLIRTEVAVRPDFARAADLGVTSSAIGDTLRIATVGDYDAGLAKLNLSQRQVPIVVKLADAAGKTWMCWAAWPCRASRGPVMLSQVASLEMTGGPAVIDRLNRSRNMNFEVELSGAPLGDVTDGWKSCRPSRTCRPA
jgi:multidrug efflux pump subunit AcrB